MLSEGQINQVRTILAMDGWNQVMMPLYAQRAKDALAALTLSPAERREHGGAFKEAADETLRATIRECEWMLMVWRNELAVYEQNRRRDELDRQEPGPGLPPVPPTANP